MITNNLSSFITRQPVRFFTIWDVKQRSRLLFHVIIQRMFTSKSVKMVTIYFIWFIRTISDRVTYFWGWYTTACAALVIQKTAGTFIWMTIKKTRWHIAAHNMILIACIAQPITECLITTIATCTKSIADIQIQDTLIIWTHVFSRSTYVNRLHYSNLT